VAAQPDVTLAELRAKLIEERGERRCHGASGLRSHWRLGSQGDEENQLHRVPVSA